MCAKFIVNHEKLDSSVSKYASAVTKFEQGKDAYNKAIKSVDWDDEAAGKWKEVADKFSLELEKAYNKLLNNHTLVSAMQKAAADDQSNTISGIGRIYNS